MHNFAFVLVLVVLSSNPLSAEDWKTPVDRYAEVHKAYLNAPRPIPADSIRNFAYFARDREAMRSNVFLKNPRFAGAQIMYPWALLEPQKDKYDLSLIAEDYQFLKSRGKKLFIQLQDATFNPKFNAAPAYLMSTRRGQLNHTIAMMHENTFTVPLGIAVQDGNDIGETGTNRLAGPKNLVPALHAFAKDFLRVSYMFWSNQEPYFSQDVLPSFADSP